MTIENKARVQAGERGHNLGGQEGICWVQEEVKKEACGQGIIQRNNLVGKG